MDRQIDMLSDERKKFRKDSLSALSLEHRNQYTNDTIAVMMQVMGMIPLGRQNKRTCFAFLEGKAIAGLEEAIAFQLHTFFNEEVVHTLSNVISKDEEYDVLKFLLTEFNAKLDFDMAQKLTPPCYIPALKQQIHYAALIEFSHLTSELIDALTIEVWCQYIYNPKNYAQTSFVRLLLGKYYKYWNIAKNNLGNLDPNSSCITSMLNSVGISKVRLIKDNHPESELSVNQLIPFMRWDERWNEHGMPCLEARSIIQYFSDKAPHTKEQRLDIGMWLSRHPKWLNQYTFFDYETGNEHHSRIEKVRIHNHNLIDYISLPKYNGKVNLKKHPKDWIMENMTEEIKILVKKTYEFLNKGVALGHQYGKRIIRHYPNQEVTYLGSAQMLIDESTLMRNCVDGLRYVTAMLNGDDHFYHLANSVEDEHGMTLQININSRTMPFGLIREVKGYGNRDLSEKELEYVAEFVANIYFPDMGFNQIHLLTQYHK
jgi:hypothetical protein